MNRTRHQRTFLRAALCLALAASAISCHAEPDPAAPDLATRPGPELQPLSERIRYAPVMAADVLEATLLPAAIVLPSNATAMLAPYVEGRLARWLVAPGDTVLAGDPMAELLSPRWSDVDALARQLRSQIEQRQQQLTQFRSAVDGGLRPIDDVLVLEAELARLQSELQSLLTSQRSLRAAAGADTDSQSGAAWVWRAPAAGYVQSLQCATGAPVGPLSACVELVDLSQRWVRVDVPESIHQRIPPTVTLTFRPSGSAVESGPLALVRFEPVADAASRTISWYFQATADLVPGTSGIASLHVGAPTDAVFVPDAALTILGELRGVLVHLDPQDPAAAAFLPVEVLGRNPDGGWVARAAELTPGTEVAVEGVFLLKSLVLMNGGQP